VHVIDCVEISLVQAPSSKVTET